MQKVDKYISNLLYDHDCVIVPQLGGFVANYSSAKIHPTQHIFLPPSKKIVFNTNLKNNDGLLANEIAQNENASYPDALKYIHFFVENTNANLNKGEKVEIEEVGKLFLDVERNIQFEPDTNTNHLLDAFGLSQFQSPAIKRDSISKRIEKEFVDRKPIPATHKKIPVKRYVALALIVPFLFFMIWIPLKTDLLSNINYADLNPFASKEKSVYVPIEKSNLKEYKSDVLETPSLIDNTDTAKYKSIQLTENSTVSITAQIYPEIVENIKVDSTKVNVNTVKVDNNTGYHLVAGCFQVHENAINFVETLKKENLPAAIIGKNDKNMYVVSCGDYATSNEARAELKKVRRIRPNAWLYKN